MVKSILIAGVGGQGILLASNLLATVLQDSGYDVKKSEVHGMSQRGGDVTSIVRWGEHVYSPIIGKGGADYLLALEKLESLRTLPYLKPDGIALVNEYRFNPLPVSAGLVEYPENIQETLSNYPVTLHFVSAFSIALNLGNVRTMNIVMLGSLARIMEITTDRWFSAIDSVVPEKHRAINKKAFTTGYEAIA